MDFVTYRDILGKFLRDTYPTGGKDVTGDYSATAKKFFVGPPSGQNYEISGLNLNLVTAGDVTSDGYGDGAELTNGISVTLEDSNGTVLLDLLDGIKIKSNADWGRLIDFDTIIDRGVGNAHLPGKGYFPLLFLSPLKLFGTNGDRLVLTFNDNFSGTGSNVMLEHDFSVTGRIERVA